MSKNKTTESKSIRTTPTRKPVKPAVASDCSHEPSDPSIEDVLEFLISRSMGYAEGAHAVFCANRQGLSQFAGAQLAAILEDKAREISGVREIIDDVTFTMQEKKRVTVLDVLTVQALGFMVQAGFEMGFVYGVERFREEIEKFPTHVTLIKKAERGKRNTKEGKKKAAEKRRDCELQHFMKTIVAMCPDSTSIPRGMQRPLAKVLGWSESKVSRFKAEALKHGFLSDD